MSSSRVALILLAAFLSGAAAAELGVRLHRVVTPSAPPSVEHRRRAPAVPARAELERRAPPRPVAL